MISWYLLTVSMISCSSTIHVRMSTRRRCKKCYMQLGLSVPMAISLLAFDPGKVLSKKCYLLHREVIPTYVTGGKSSNHRRDSPTKMVTMWAITDGIHLPKW